MRLHELHPSLAHFPLVLFPLSVALDLLGVGTRRPALCDSARALIPAAAVAGAVTAGAGLVAQEAVRVPKEAHPLLISHRNLNLAAVAAVAVLAVQRRKRESPSASYLGSALLVTAAMAYTAYLGGKMVYQHGVGVEPGGGVKPERSPTLTLDNVGAVASTALRNAKEAAEHAGKHLSKGELVPTLGLKV